MNKTIRTKPLLSLCVLFSLACTAWGSMIGIGREGDFVIEMFAERSEVARGAGIATVTLPKESEALFRAADIRQGDGVWNGDATAGKATGSVISLVPGWLSCTFKFKEATKAVPVPVERFHVLRWSDLGARFTSRLDGLAATNEAAWRSGLAGVLGNARKVFGGQSMVTGFPGTKYATEFANLQRAFDRCVRKGQMRGFSAGRDLKSDYETLFGAEWPSALLAVFFCGDGRPLEIRRIVDASGRPFPDVFESPLPVRLEGTNRVEGVFPANTELQIAYAAADARDGDAAAEQVFTWRSVSDGGCPAWFMLQSAPAGGGVAFSSTQLENSGSVAVAVKVSVGEFDRVCTLPVDERVLLHLVIRPGTVLRVNGEPDPSDPHARDWTVSSQKESDSLVRFTSARKAPPGLVFNNPEMMPVDVTVMPVGGGWGSSTKLTLQAGETGIGIPVPAHKALVVGYKFRSDFHRAGHKDIPALFYGDRSNLVLRAELKGDPEVVVQNTGSAAVRITGMSGPSPAVVIPARKSATVTVPAGRRTILTGVVSRSEYQCEPLTVPAMAAGDKTTVRLRLTPKSAPQVVLRNAGGMMDVEATLMSGAGRPLAKPVSIKRGASSRPMVLPEQENLFFRLSYSNDRFSAQGRLPLPTVSRGETKIVDIPNPTSNVQLQTSGKSAPSAVPPPKPAPATEPKVPTASPASSVPAAKPPAAPQARLAPAVKPPAASSAKPAPKAPASSPAAQPVYLF